MAKAAAKAVAKRKKPAAKKAVAKKTVRKPAAKKVSRKEEEGRLKRSWPLPPWTGQLGGGAYGRRLALCKKRSTD